MLDRPLHSAFLAGSALLQPLASEVSAITATARRGRGGREILGVMSRCRRYGSDASIPEAADRRAASEPLRILFCGSDDFSAASLRALHAEHLRDPALVRSIDVVVRPGKLTGRGLKTIAEVPLKAVATALGLRVHERDTFTGWSPPLPPPPSDDPRSGSGPGPESKSWINLIIAVSFGLFVPPRLLRAALYGGLNVHPSLLPDLRGPAPIHRALLAGRPFTGVTLQTLDDRAFDRGAILAQTSGIAPATEGRDGGRGEGVIPIPAGCTPEDLRAVLAAEGATMLVRALREGAHVPPLRPRPCWVPPAAVGQDGFTLLHAPKITKADLEIDWAGLIATATATATGGSGKNGNKNTDGTRTVGLTAEGRPLTPAELVRRRGILGPLWTRLRVPQASAGGSNKTATGSEAAGDTPIATKRALFEEIETVTEDAPAAAAAAAAELHSLVWAQDLTSSSETVESPSVSTSTSTSSPSGQPQPEQQQRGVHTAYFRTPFKVDPDGSGAILIQLDAASSALSPAAAAAAATPPQLPADKSWLRVKKLRVEGGKTVSAERAVRACTETG